MVHTFHISNIQIQDPNFMRAEKYTPYMNDGCVRIAQSTIKEIDKHP